MSHQRSIRKYLFLISLLSLLLSLILAPQAHAAENGSSAADWNVSQRYLSELTAEPDGSVIANTGIAGGGVPTGGSLLTEASSTGTTAWQVPYQDQDIVTPNPVVDARGNHYWMYYASNGAPQLIASHGTAQLWAKTDSSGADHHLAVGTDGNVYDFTANQLHGYAPNDGHELFAPVALNEFTSGSYDRLFAYDQGLIAVSGSGKIQYLDYSGHTVGTAYSYIVNDANMFERSLAASANGSLFVVWYTEGLTPDGCFSSSGQAILAKFDSTGQAWQKTLPSVERCNYGGPYVATTPSGGAVVTSDAANEADVQAVDAAGQTSWHQTVSAPSNAYGVRSVLPAHIDDAGQVLVPVVFTFDCAVYNDTCYGVKVDRFSNSGDVEAGILLQGSSTSNQESWAIWNDTLALTPNKAVLGLEHIAGGYTYGGTPSYSLSAFGLTGLGAEYPASSLWKLMPTAGTPTPSPTKHIVGLGDSVAAGEGINYKYTWDGKKWVRKGPVAPSWRNTTDSLGANYQDCHQSGKGYGDILAINGYSMNSMACTGASAAEGILSPEVFDGGSAPPAQTGGTCANCSKPNPVFDAHHPDVVLLTLGADDIHFGDWIQKCYKPSAECNTSVNTTGLNKQLTKAKADLRAVLTELNRRTKAAGKKLLVVVTDYYNPFPITAKTCIDTNAVGVIGITNAEKAWLMSGLADLNTNIKSEVAYAKSHDSSLKLKLADINNVMASHRFCDKDPWVYGPSIRYNPTSNSPAPFHPTPAGQRAIANVVRPLVAAG